MKDSAAAPDEPRMAADFMVELRKGSFTDIEAANRHVNATLLRNRIGVDRVVERKASRAAPIRDRPEAGASKPPIR
jgi:hypothetical protein